MATVSRTLALGVAFSVASCHASTSTTRAVTLAITHVHVVDVAAGITRADQTVLVDGDRIRAVGPAGSTAVPRGTPVIDGQGKYLMPGLWDMHVHLGRTGRSALPLLVINGVTGVRHMGGGFSDVQAWRDSVGAGSLLGPRIVMSGAMIESAQWRAAVIEMLTRSGDTASAREIRGRIGIATPEDARRMVDSIATLGVLIIKVRNSPPRDTYFTLLREANRRGLRVVGHPPGRDVTLAEASDSGQASLEHLLLDIDRGGNWRSTLDAMPAAERADLYRRFVRNGTALVPTLVADVGFRMTPDSVVLSIIEDPSGARDQRRRYITADLAQVWRDQIAMKKLEGTQPDWVGLHRTAAARLREMDSAGVSVFAGTDLGVPLTFPGFALHDELALQVREGGRTPARALWGATLGPALFLGFEGELGTVAAGKLADLVLLDADPLLDIANVGRIRAVVRNGRLLDRATLDRMLGEVAAGAGAR